MDLLRFVDKDNGPYFIDGRALFALCPDATQQETKLVAFGQFGVIASLDLSADVEEVALMIERAVPGARIHRID